MHQAMPERSISCPISSSSGEDGQVVARQGRSDSPGDYLVPQMLAEGGVADGAELDDLAVAEVGCRLLGAHPSAVVWSGHDGVSVAKNCAAWCEALPAS